MGWRVEEEGERRQGARGRGGGWRGWRAGAAVVEGGSDVVMWCTGHLGALGWGRTRLPPVVRVQHTQRKYLYRALQRTQGSGGRSETVPQQAGPSADARIGGEGEWGKGATQLGGQGARVEGAPLAEMQVGGNGGGDTLLT